MYFLGNYRQVGIVDVAPIRDALATLGEAEWNASATRQQIYKAHAHTRTIPLIYDEDMRHTGATRRPLFDRLEPVLAPAMARIRDFYAPAHEAAGTPVSGGYFVRIVLVRLAGEGEVTSHTDNGPSLQRAHRIHLPIVTSDRVLFAVRGEIRNLPAGELWEINNRRPHAVRNAGTDRIHAILDYVVPGEWIDDPDGAVVA